MEKSLEGSLKFEDLEVGAIWISPSRYMSQGEIREFADLTGDFTPIHIDEDYAATTPFRGTIAHGLLGLSIMAGLSSDSPNIDTMALVDIGGWRFRKPIYVGDEIHVVTEVVELSEHGRRHGLVKWYRKLVNQREEIVQDGVLSTLVNRRDSTTRKKMNIHPAQSSILPKPHLQGSIVETAPEMASQTTL